MASSRPVSTIIAIFDEGGRVSTGGSSYTLTATAIADDGYSFSGWEIVSYSGVCQNINGRLSGMDTTTLTVDNSEEENAKSGPLRVRALFVKAQPPVEPEDPETYSLTTSVSPNDKCGTVSPSGTSSYKEGATVSVSAAEVDKAYKFDHFDVDGSRRDARTVSVTMTRDHTVVAVFSLKYHGILFSPSAGGAILCDQSGNILCI